MLTFAPLFSIGNPGTQKLPPKNCFKGGAGDFFSKLECINEILFTEYNMVVCTLFFWTVPPIKFFYGR